MKVLVSSDDIKKFDPFKLKQAVNEITAAEIKGLPKEDSSESDQPHPSPQEYSSHVVNEQANEFGIWAKYDLTGDWTPADRDRYEWFVAGFLYYYDTEIRNNSLDHQIYFDWKKTDLEKTKVVIYMKPAPLAAHRECLPTPANGGTTDPPRPPQGPPPPKNT